MARYLALTNWTEKGVASFRETTDRADAVAELARSVGVELREAFWCLGPYDVVLVLEAPDDEAIAAFKLELRAGGNVRVVTMRAYSRQEMDGILARVSPR